MTKFNCHLLTVIVYMTLVGILPFYISTSHFTARGGTLSSLLRNSATTTPGQASPSTPHRTTPLIEEFSFLIKDLKMDHQSEIQNLNITVRLRYAAGIQEAAYPDFRLILGDIRDFLKNYPNKKDYWEIVNKKLTRMVINKYFALHGIISEIQVSPSRLEPYLRSSIVTHNRSNVTKVNRKKRKI